MEDIHLRHLEPSDYAFIISVVNDWWDGRNMVDMLPKLFCVHFRQTSFVAEQGGNIVGFIVGFISQTLPHEAYIHFVGVHPAFRRKGVGHMLYKKFFEAAKKSVCTIVRCVTSPVNKASLSFHQRLGFSMEPNDKKIDAIPVAENYDGRNNDRVLLYKDLGG